MRRSSSHSLDDGSVRVISPTPIVAIPLRCPTDGPGVYLQAAVTGHDETPRPVVLLADDEEAITDNLAPFLERSGFAVHVVHDGEAALAAFRDLDPDLCVLDVLMPRLNGREVLR